MCTNSCRYYKGEGGGIATWDPRPDVFPEGSLAPFYEKTGWLGQLHNRYWSTDTPYATKNGGKYNFVFDGSSVCVPDDQQFWNDLIANKSRGGEKMFMYEQVGMKMGKRPRRARVGRTHVRV